MLRRLWQGWVRWWRRLLGRDRDDRDEGPPRDTYPLY
jgi:hypothetical protein